MIGADRPFEGFWMAIPRFARGQPIQQRSLRLAMVLPDWIHRPTRTFRISGLGSRRGDKIQRTPPHLATIAGDRASDDPTRSTSLSAENPTMLNQNEKNKADFSQLMRTPAN
jgi:hypothetical protein